MDRDPLAVAHRELGIAEGHVDRQAHGIEGLHRSGQALEHHVGLLALRGGGQPRRGPQGVGRVEGLGPQGALVEQLVGGEAAHELPPQGRSGPVQVVDPVPVGEHGARLAHVDRRRRQSGQVGVVLGLQRRDGHLAHPVAAVHDRLAQRPRREAAVGQRRVGQLVEVEAVGARGALVAGVVEHGGVLAGAGRPGRLLAPVQRRVVAGEQLGGVGHPERVVGVEDVVVAADLRLVVEGHEAGVAGALLLHPLEGGVGAVEQERPVVRRDLDHRVRGQRGLVGGEGLVGQIGGGRGVGVPGLPVGRHRDGVEQRHAVDLSVDGLELLEVVGLEHGEVLLDELVVVDVGVAVGDGLGVGPPEAGEVDDRPVVAGPGGALDGLELPVVAQHLDLVGGGRDLADLVAVAVLRRIAVHEVERVGGESGAGRDRVGPAELLGEADADAGHARQLHAVGVELAGHRQVDLPEPQLALPREVGVGHQEPAAVRGPLRADGPAVGRDGCLGQAADPAAGRVGGPARSAGGGRRSRGVGRTVATGVAGGCGRGDERTDAGAAGVEGDRTGVGVDLHGLERPHPVLAGAPAGHAVGADLVEVRVPAGHVGLEQVAGVGADVGPVGGREVEDADGAPLDVAVDVGVLVAGAEPPGALAADLDHLVGEVAGAVLAAGVALAEGHVAERVAGDVGDPVGGAADGRLVGVAGADLGGVWVGCGLVAAVGAGGEGGGEQQRAGHPDDATEVRRMWHDVSPVVPMDRCADDPTAGVRRRRREGSGRARPFDVPSSI